MRPAASSRPDPSNNSHAPEDGPLEPECPAHATTSENPVRRQPSQPAKVSLKVLPDLFPRLHAGHCNEAADPARTAGVQAALAKDDPRNETTADTHHTTTHPIFASSILKSGNQLPTFRKLIDGVTKVDKLGLGTKG